MDAPVLVCTIFYVDKEQINKTLRAYIIQAHNSTSHRDFCWVFDVTGEFPFMYQTTLIFRNICDECYDFSGVSLKNLRGWLFWWLYAVDIGDVEPKNAKNLLPGLVFAYLSYLHASDHQTNF